jgi:hypothetical protein
MGGRPVIALEYGYTKGVPEGVTTAWGARAIVNRDWTVDLVPDRQASTGPRAAELVDHLQRVGSRDWFAHASEALHPGELHNRERCEATIYEDGVIVMKANTNASGGYLYVCAYFRDEDGTGR